MWDPKKILSLENSVDQQRCVWRLAWDFSMRMAMAKIRPNGFERRRASFEDMWKDIYRMNGYFEGYVYGYWMLKVGGKLIDTSGWLNYAFLHREFTSRWHREFVRPWTSNGRLIQPLTVGLPPLNHWPNQSKYIFFSYQHKFIPNKILFCWGLIREIRTKF